MSRVKHNETADVILSDHEFTGNIINMKFHLNFMIGNVSFKELSISYWAGRIERAIGLLRGHCPKCNTQKLFGL